MEKERLVPDTSIFTNPDVYKQFGSNPSEAFTNFLLMVAELEGEINVYLPSSVFEELKRMLKNLKLPLRQDQCLR